jgi:hypothetical protein
MIRLDKQPSIDGLGVKRWIYPVDDFVTLYIYARPAPYRCGEPRYYLRAQHRDGRHLWHGCAGTKRLAAKKARLAQDRFAGEFTYASR